MTAAERNLMTSPAPTSLTHFAPVVLRVGLGCVFIAHAYAKAFIYTFPGTARFFEASGFPGWTAYPVFALELVGGLALILGFRTRYVALVLAAVMLGALKPHLANGWMFTSAGGGWEYVAFLLVALVTLVLSGSGAYGLDGFLFGALPSTDGGPDPA
jgi:putative oxidoreductase